MLQKHTQCLSSLQDMDVDCSCVLFRRSLSGGEYLRSVAGRITEVSKDPPAARCRRARFNWAESNKRGTNAGKTRRLKRRSTTVSGQRPVMGPPKTSNNVDFGKYQHLGMKRDLVPYISRILLLPMTKEDISSNKQLCKCMPRDCRLEYADLSCRRRLVRRVRPLYPDNRCRGPRTQTFFDAA